jgi:hypothetical protein
LESSHTVNRGDGYVGYISGFEQHAIVLKPQHPNPGKWEPFFLDSVGWWAMMNPQSRIYFYET